MTAIQNWIKSNKLASALLVIVAYFLFSQSSLGHFPLTLQRITAPSFNSKSAYGEAVGMDMAMEESIEMGRGVTTSSIVPPVPPIDDVAPTDSPDRLVIKDTNLSMVVNDVANTISLIEQLATQHGGFLVSSNLNVPEGASSGTITIRVKADQRSQALSAIKQLGVRTVSESVSGRDVTDQYEDIAAKLEVLETTKTKFESFMDQAVKIQDLLQVQRELINLQSQIDNLKGRQEYLQKSADLTKITAYLSTDELALPYTPDTVWRPQVIFKQAVRSLITTFRSLGNRLIWLGVYAVIWVPLLLLAFIVYKLRSRRSSLPA